MKRLLAVLVVLAAASPAMAELIPGLTVQIDPGSVNWTVAGNGVSGTSVMSVNLILTANGGDTNLCNDFGASMWLTGANGATFTAVPGYLSNQTAATLAGYVLPQSYAWAAFDGGAVAQAQPSGISGASNRLDFDIGDSWANSLGINTIALDEVVATFFFSYSGDHAAFTQVNAWIGEEGLSGGNAGFSTDAYTYDEAAVSIQDVNLAPEPATLSLLALGLAGLVLRRKKN